MSSIQPTNCCCSSKSTFNEHGWLMQIRRIIDEEVEEEDGDIHVSIFGVPKTLKDMNLYAYTPLMVALGPYHRWRPEIQEMERYKLYSAKRFQKQGVKLDNIVHRLMMLEHRIRACYHKYLDINGETLAWMMAIDATFLLEIGEIYSDNERKTLFPISLRMSQHLVHWARRKSSLNAILRDIMMLENQIPLFVLREMLIFRFPSSYIVDKTLNLILVGLAKDLSPFKVLNWSKIKLYDCEHILDFLYQNTVPKVEETVEINENVDQEINEERKVCKLLTKLKDFLRQIPFKIILKLPWIFICSLPGFTILMALFSPKENNRQEHANDPQSIQDNKPLLLEEITIPSVTELSKFGVNFLPKNGDITSINFDQKSKKFYIPIISIDVNTEVVLRNLVAYEASSALSSLVFTRYIELMNGIIDTKDDVKLLRERGIILNYLKSDEDAANLWNGMSKSLRLTRVTFLDEIIENVNSYYNSNWKVVFYKIMTTYVINSWQILGSLIVVLLLFLLIFETLSPHMYSPHMVGRQPRG